ncbi:MAG: hypothetical protein L3J96_06970, partial [Thermoplasmata archaeon]|nr:hypothetical protein [Thermoplasmata archaeon]
AQSLKFAKTMHRSGQGTYGPVVEARGDVEALAAELNACADDLRDEVDLLQAQLEIRKADVAGAQAQVAKVTQSRNYTEALHKNKVVSQEEVEREQMEVDIRSAELLKKQAEMNEVALRIKQATRRRDEAIQHTERAKGLVPEHEAPPGPAAPATKR